jgi:hypothetical protein
VVDYAREEWGTAWTSFPFISQKEEPRRLAQIDKAKRNLKDRRKQLTHNNFIASTSFGLRVRFLSKHYDEMWKRVLAPVFQGHSLRREELWRVADQAKRARNATAHYEPVIEKGKPDDFQLDEFHGQLVHYLQLFSPRTSAWVSRNSRFTADSFDDFKGHWIARQLLKRCRVPNILTTSGVEASKCAFRQKQPIELNYAPTRLHAVGLEVKKRLPRN